MLGKSQVVDLTQVQGDYTPGATAEQRARPEGPGEGERSSAALHLPSAGDLATQLHLPSSMVNGKPTVAQLPPRDLLANAVVVDIAARVAATADYRLTAEDLRAWERRHGRIPKGCMVLLHTGWARRWGDPARYLNLDPQGLPRIPGISLGAVAFLVNERNIRGVGLDAWIPKQAPGTSGLEDGGHPLLYAGKWELVNLTNLDRLPVKGSKVVIAPLRLDAGSAPARVIAILP
jgi:kynurenine formamidase